MARPAKCRKVCCLPRNDEFKPRCGNHEFITLQVDEYESIRLLDKEGFSQEQAAQYMHVSRPTVQHIYDTARKKLALALVDGYGIRIKGGNFSLCDGKEHDCGCGGCCKHRGQHNARREDI